MGKGRRNHLKHALGILCAVIAAPLIAIAADDLESLEMEVEAVQNSFFAAINGSYQAPPIPDLVRALPADQQRAAVRTMAGVAKTFMGSSEFKKDYSAAYKRTKPKGFGIPNLSVDALTGSAADKALGEEKKEEPWKLEKDPNAQLRKRLKSFLSVTEDVDFDAATTGSNRRGQFNNSEYETKPPEWKMCFRAGPEVADEVRTVAKEWLKELEPAEPKKK